MAREIIEYLIPHVPASHVGAHLDRHFAAEPRLSVRLKDLTPVASFAVGYFFDAMQKVTDKIMLGGEAIDVFLPSGWKARSVDIGHLWKRHIEFTSPSDDTRGFILQGLLDMVETADPAEPEFDMDAYVEKLMSSFKIQDDLVDSNKSSPEYLPENSVRIEEYSVFPFAVSEMWFESAKQDVYKNLLKSTHVSEAFEYRPQSERENGTFEADRGTRSITEPGAAVEALQRICELVFEIEPELAYAAMQAHAPSVYNTLVQEHVTLLQAVRGALANAGEDRLAPLSGLIEKFWRRAACEDVLRNLHFVTESAEALIEMGHTSHKDQFDCNDGRTRAYATTDGDTVSVYSEWEEWSTLIKVRGNRIEISKCDFKTGEVGQKVVDFEYEDGEVIQINEICPHDDLTGGVMNRSLSDLSSVHCYVVTDRRPKSGSGSPTP